MICVCLANMRHSNIWTALWMKPIQTNIFIKHTFDTSYTPFFRIYGMHLLCSTDVEILMCTYAFNTKNVLRHTSFGTLKWISELKLGARLKNKPCLTILKMKAARSSEMFVHHSTVSHPRNRNLHPHMCENLKTHKIKFLIKNEVVPIRTMKAPRGSESTAPFILNPCTRCRWVVSLTPQPLYPRYPLNRWLGGPQSRSGFEPGSSNPQPSHYTDWLRYPGCFRSTQKV
jgi:hypothetical protein